MLKQIKIGFFALLAVAFLASCKNDQDAAANDAAVQSAAGTDAAAATDPAAAQAAPTGITTQAPGAASATGQAVSPTTPPDATAAPSGPTTTVEFTETTFDFGKVNAPEKVRHTFKFKNTGKEPLIISSVKPSCGCTAPNWTKEPVAPGKTGEVMVEFDSKGKSGPTTKNVTVTANTDPPQTMLYFKADIKGEANAGGTQGH